MLRSLHLKDFVIVDQADIDFAPGFTVLTGETGAGKSILLDAVGLLLGDRSDAAYVREGCARADIAGIFAVDPVMHQWLAQSDLASGNADRSEGAEPAQGKEPGGDLEPEDGVEPELLVRRIVDREGRSRAQVNGHPVTIAQLRAIGERLVDIHGQHESQSLMRSAAQRELVDRFGRHEPRLAEVGSAWQSWQAARRSLDAARNRSREDAMRADRLAWEIGEIDALDLREGEWEELSQEQHRLAHARDLIEGAGQAALALGTDDRAIVDQLRTIQQRVDALADVDQGLRPIAEMLDSAAIQIDEAAHELSAYADRADLDPQRLAEVETRVGDIFTTARKLRLEPEALPAHLATIRAEHEALAASADVDALEKRVQELEKTYRKHAQALGKDRRAAAGTLAEGATRELKRLGMADASLVIAVDDAEASSTGTDAIEFRIRAHAGATPRAIARYASGGELSRIGLSIAAVAAGANPCPVLIFDEADAGIGGAVASVVGELLQRLAVGRQVLCVTHLPQVASRGDHHAKVEKTAAKDGRGPSSRVRTLDDDARVQEIARMLGAHETTEKTRAHAVEMLEISRRSGARAGERAGERAAESKGDGSAPSGSPTRRKKARA